MKKITLNLLTLMFVSTMLGQIFSTGTIALNSNSATNLNYSVKIDVTSTLVTMTLIGPSSGWLAMGFNNTSMANSGDVVIFDGTNITDRRFDGFAVVPVLDAIQNWTLTSNSVNSGVRTVIGTRARDTGDVNDYVFSATASSLNLVYARKVANFSINYHGGDSCGTVSTNFTLANNTFNIESFKMYPNPAKGFTNIELPTNVDFGSVKIYDALGRVVKNQEITTTSNEISTSDLNTGTYMVVLRTDYGNATKSLVVE